MLSGAKGSARKAFAVLLCLCLISVPGFAGVLPTFVNGGFFYPSAVNPFYFNTGTSIEYPLNGDFSATFTNDSSTSSGVWTFRSDLLTYPATSFVVVQDSYFEILFNVKEPYKIDVDGIDNTGYFGFFYELTSGGSSSWSSNLKSVQFIYDGNRSDLSALSSGKFESPTEDFNVYRYFGYRFVFDSLSKSLSLSANQYYFNIRFFDNAVFNTVFWENGDVIESIDVNTGLLQEINGELNEVNTQLTELNGTMSDIKDTVTDTSEQLQNPNSNIWQAAGEKISETVTGLFVPTEAELDAKKQELEQKLNDKLGTLAEVRVGGEQLVDTVVSGFNGGGRSYQFEFPGISVPMNGEEYVILSPQTFSFENNKVITVFQDALSVVIAGICFFSLIHICEDAIYCIISGVSYWGFIRSRHDR